MKKNNHEKHREPRRKKITTEKTEIHGEKNKRKNIKSDNVRWISSVWTSVTSVVKKKLTTESTENHRERKKRKE